MAFDERLAERIRRITDERGDVAEKHMFGGVAFLLHGKMFCGVVKEDLMARIGPDAYLEALEQPHVREMNFTGRPMKGYVYVEPEGCRSEATLRQWVAKTLAFVETLDPGKPKRAPERRKSNSV